MNTSRSDDHMCVSRRNFVSLGGSAACALGLGLLASAGLTFATPETAYATVEGDQTPLTDAEIEERIRSGEIMTEFPESGISALSATNGAIKTVAGANRYETNAKQVCGAFAEGSNWAIVASGLGYADSICAAGLAGALSCPIILTDQPALSSDARETIALLGATNFLLLGDEKSASQQVEIDLRTIAGSSGSVERLAGINRYETQMKVYQYGVERGLWTGDLAIVSNATGFADALAASPVSYKFKAPVFFVDDTNFFPAAQEEAVRSCGKKRFILTGDDNNMSPRVQTMLEDLGASVTRLYGVNRYKTSLAIAQYAVNELGMSWDGVAIASGMAPFDALGGGPVQGKANSVMVLMEEDDYHNAPFIPFSGKPTSVTFFGDKNRYSYAYKTRFALQAGYSLSDIEGLKIYIDAGHGGSDPGASGCGYREADLTAELAKKVSSVLSNSYGMPVYTNTKGNSYKVRHPEAKAMDCGIFVSIHFNASGGTGTESYIHSYNSAAGSKALQHSTHTKLVSALGLADRHEQSEAFAVTSGPLPSVLLEVCFIDTAGDMSRYQSRKDAVATAIAQGIMEA